MQLCQILFYQKIARKKVARVNAALEKLTFFYVMMKSKDFAQHSKDGTDNKYASTCCAQCAVSNKLVRMLHRTVSKYN